jgi:copper chaperone
MTRLDVQGMTCSHCSAAVKRALEAVPGVESATVDLDAGHASVTGSAPVDALIAAVVDEGYQAAPAA